MNWEGRRDGFSGMIPELPVWKGDPPPEDIGGLDGHYALCDIAGDPKYPDSNKAPTIPLFPEFDRDRVQNSLESWGMQGVIGEDRIPLDNRVRMEMFRSVLSAAEIHLVFDTESERICSVSPGGRKPKKRPRSAGMFPPPSGSVSQSDIDRDPERYVAVSDSPAEFLSDYTDGFVRKHRRRDLCRKPDESAGAHYERAFGGMGPKIRNKCIAGSRMRLRKRRTGGPRGTGISFSTRTILPPGRRRPYTAGSAIRVSMPRMKMR